MARLYTGSPTVAGITTFPQDGPATEYDGLILAAIALVLDLVWIVYGFLKKQTEKIMFGVLALVFAACCYWFFG